MTAIATAAPRSLAFGSLEDRLWGVSWLASDSPECRIGLGTQSGSGYLDGTLDGQGPDQPWRIVGPGLELEFSPTHTASQPSEEDQASGFDQLCRVAGRFSLQGQERRVSCLGWRAAAERPPAERIESFRQVAAWFEAGDGLALLARRPPSSHGQEADLVTAAVLAPDSPLAVFDPRLSTTYGGDGQPRRVGVELWLGTEEEQIPRRAAGEAVGEPAAWGTDGLDLRAQLFRWHSGGLEGAGIYLLGAVR